MIASSIENLELSFFLFFYINLIGKREETIVILSVFLRLLGRLESMVAIKKILSNFFDDDKKFSIKKTGTM